MGQINLPRLDPPPVEYENDLSDEMGIWLSDVSDAINSAFQTLETNLNPILSPILIDVGGHGAGPIDVTVTGMSINSLVIYTLVSSTNPVTITSLAPSTNKFTVTFSGDPGASAIISYIAFV